jgi:hypothetical protein
MSPLLFKHWSDISSSMGVLYGLVNFLGLQNLGLSPELSFGLSFVSGYALTYFLNQHFHDTIEQDAAKNISHWVQTFEEQ